MSGWWSTAWGWRSARSERGPSVSGREQPVLLPIAQQLDRGADTQLLAHQGLQVRHRLGAQVQQVGNVALSTVLQDAWARGQTVTVHGWVYGLRDGLLKDLQVSMDGTETVVDVFRTAIKRYPRSDGSGGGTGDNDAVFDSLDDD